MDAHSLSHVRARTRTQHASTIVGTGKGPAQWEAPVGPRGELLIGAAAVGGHDAVPDEDAPRPRRVAPGAARGRRGWIKLRSGVRGLGLGMRRMRRILRKSADAYIEPRFRDFAIKQTPPPWAYSRTLAVSNVPEICPSGVRLVSRESMLVCIHLKDWAMVTLAAQGRRMSL